jgi:4-amino-4-deoxy-L-arabinose transferase-like glycosyltransferase
MIEFTAWPEMLAWPYLMLHGWLPYRDIAIAHTPLMLLVLTTFYKLVGVGILQLKIFTWSLMALNLFLTYWVTNKVFNRKTAVIAACVYLPLSIYYQANGLWFDLALVPFVLLLYYFLFQKKFLHSGVIFGLGILTKQTFSYLLIPVAISLINKLKDLTTHNPNQTIIKIRQFIFGGTIVLIFASILMYMAGIADDFYFWAVKFGVGYLPNASGQVNLPNIKQFVVQVFPFSIAVLNPTLLIWIIPSLLGVYPRWELFHFQPALPFLSMVIAQQVISQKFKYVVFVYLLVTTIIVGRGVYRNIKTVTRFYESDVQKISQDIRSRGAKKIYVINYWDNIYALSNTIPSTKPLIPNIPWYLEVEGVKESIEGDVKTELPDAVVVKDRSDINWKELNDFLDRYYQCTRYEKNVELCWKN